jgi:hypothetical protein
VVSGLNIAGLANFASHADANSGDFENIDFAAARVQGGFRTYYGNGPNEGHEVGPLEGQNLAYDNGDNNDIREELEASDFACEDRIIFFTRMGIAGVATEQDQNAFITYHFDARNNGTQAVGYREIIAAGISLVDFPAPSQTSETGNVNLDGDEDVSLVSQRYITKPAGDPGGAVPSDFGTPDAEALEAVVKVAGLDPGDQLIVRIDVRFACFGVNPTGNLHAAIAGIVYDGDGNAATVDDQERVNTGQQDVPMLGLGEVATPTPTPSPSPSPTPTPTPSPSPSPTPTAPPSPSPTPTPTPSPSPSPTPTASPSPSPTPTPTPSPSPSPTPTSAPETETPVITLTPSPTPSPTPTGTTTATVSPTPTPPATSTPTASPTQTASPEPTPTQAAVVAAAISGPQAQALPATGGAPSGERAITEYLPVMLLGAAGVAGAALILAGRRRRKRETER